MIPKRRGPEPNNTRDSFRDFTEGKRGVGNIFICIYVCMYMYMLQAFEFGFLFLYCYVLCGLCFKEVDVLKE